MAVDIHNLIAAISPDTYCKPELVSKVKKEVKKLLEEGKKDAYVRAAKIAQLRATEPLHEQDPNNPHFNAFEKLYLRSPVDKRNVSYDFFGENLEPTYFWLIDTIAREYKQHKGTDKLIDNFVAAPGSAFFSEMGMKATKMQEEAMKLLGTANQLIRTILNLVYDLKEFKMRLDVYDRIKSKKKEERDGAMMSLKQIWMDTVDAKRGTGSIKGLAFGQQGQFVTLIDAFMVANDEKLEDEKGNALDLNERVRRLLQQKMTEFLIWAKESEKELRKRFEIEKLYLRSQVNAVQLYARWVKPYLKAARALEQNASPSSSLVTAFNTSLFELTLMSKGTWDNIGDTGMGILPKSFREPYYGTKTRKFFTVMITDMKFRVSPGKVGQNYAFRGRLEVDFASYALNTDELEIFKDQIEKDDLADVMSLMEGTTTDSLEKIKLDLDEFLKDDDKEKDKKDEDDTNPFSSLFSGFSNPFEREEKKKEKLNKMKPLKPDSVEENVFRSQAVAQSRGETDKIVGMFKKSLSMPAL
ncbi:MAG: hypothetical protein WCK90_04370 [archaeon]